MAPTNPYLVSDLIAVRSDHDGGGGFVSVIKRDPACPRLLRALSEVGWLLLPLRFGSVRVREVLGVPFGG